MDLTQRLTGVDDAKDLDQQLPSLKRSICGIDMGHNVRIAGAVEDDEFLGSTHLKSVVDNVFNLVKSMPKEKELSHWRDAMMRHLNNNNVSDCCIGIHVHYTCEGRRKLLRDATDGGWRPCKLLHKTTAAALMYRFSSAYLLQDDTLLNIAFIDMGEYQGMQVSIVQLKKDQLKVLSHAYDPSIGGYKFNKVVREYFSVKEPSYSEAEALKKRLSTESKVEFGGIILKRVKFEKLSSTLLKKVKIVLQKALNESGIRVVDINSVQVIGKGSKIPSVMKECRDFFGKEPMETILESYPDATGCFIQCAMICGAYKIPKFQIIDILPYSIELVDATENYATKKQVLFPKGHPIIPSIKSVTFRRRSTFFLDLFCNCHNGRNGSSEMISYMIGPFDCTTEKEVEVKVQLDLNGISCIESASIMTTSFLQGHVIIPVVEYERTGPQAEQHKQLIDSYKHEFVNTQDKIIAAERIENEKLQESKHKESLGNLRIEAEQKLKKETDERQKLQESKDAIESQLMKYKTLQKQHRDLRTAFKDEVQKAEKELYNISAQIQDFLNTQDKIIAAERIERGNVLKQVEELRQMVEWQSGIANFNVFSLSELQRATNNFDDSFKIGQGGFSSVYRGSLQHKLVAVKKLNEKIVLPAEFNQEVAILTKVRHPNIISFIGACPEAQALIFELAPNGSLDTFLTNGENSSRKLPWQDRIRIVSEICLALIFIHSIPPHGIAHGDLKPENILLDSNYISKLTDFGISRILDRTEDTRTPFHLTKYPKYTAPYCDPEFFGTYKLIPQCDIYSFGIILLQLVTGKGPIEIKDIVETALESGTLDELVDSSAGEWPIEEAKKLASLGLWCSDPSRRSRPSSAYDVWPSIVSMMEVAGLDINKEVLTGNGVLLNDALDNVPPSTDYRIKHIKEYFKAKKRIALELQLTESNVRLETTKKQHEKALRDKVQEAENKLVDISSQLNNSLEAETQKRIEVEKILEDQKSEHKKLQQLENQHRFALNKMRIEREDMLNEVEELRQMIEWQSSSGVVNFKFFCLSELEKTTEQFNDSFKIGQGGYSSVYKGSLQNTPVAIKVLNKGSLQGLDEFNQEVKILTKVRHPNIVSFIGACPKARALVFEFAPNGSLDTFLSNGKNSSRKLPWQDRVRIVSEICSALIYLHSLQPHSIAHGDLKPANILLDSNNVSKLADFGISRKLQKINKRLTHFHITKVLKCTPAYCDPDLFSSFELTPQCDVYSFGIIILELVTGLNPQSRMKDSIEDALDSGKLDTLVDTSAGEWPVEEAKKLALLGLWCCEQSRKKRPDLVNDVWPSIVSMMHVAGLDINQEVVTGSGVWLNDASDNVPPSTVDSIKHAFLSIFGCLCFTN